MCNCGDQTGGRRAGGGKPHSAASRGLPIATTLRRQARSATATQPGTTRCYGGSRPPQGLRLAS
eukprot:11290886-Alexandrium_andersonii.AAC.1